MAADYLMFRLKAYLWAVVFVGLALGARLLLDPVLQDHLAYSFFYVAVILTAWKAGMRETLVAVLLGFLAAAWFVIPPRHSLLITGAGGWWGAALYLFVSLAIVWFMKSGQTLRSKALVQAVEARKTREELLQLRAHCEQCQADQIFLAAIAQNARDAILSLTGEGRIATWNLAAEKLLGLSAEEALRQPLSAVLPAGHREEEQLILDQVRRGVPAEHRETLLSGKNGAGVRVSLTISPVSDGAGKLFGATLVVRSSAAGFTSVGAS